MNHKCVSIKPISFLQAHSWNLVGLLQPHRVDPGPLHQLRHPEADLCVAALRAWSDSWFYPGELHPLLSGQARQQNCPDNVGVLQ